MIIKLYFALQVTHANVNGNPVPHGTVPPPRRDCTPDDWTPFDNWVQFELADFLFEDVQMLGRKINGLMEIWGADNLKHGDSLPLADHGNIYDSIDSIPLGDVT